MKIWKEPSCILLTTPAIHKPGLEKFLNNHESHLPLETAGATDGDMVPEIAGRICYMSFGDKAGRKGPDYLNHILSVGHGSVLEHANYGVILEGISRSLSHELVRHRAGCAYSQLSQRYVDTEDMGLVIHPAICGSDVLEKLAEESFERALGEYEVVVKALMDEYKTEMKDIALDQGHSKQAVERMDEKELLALTRTARRKMAREAAREWLPNSCETKIVTTMNVRAWRYFFSMRGAPAADRQIRRCAVLIFSVLQPQAPWCFQDIERQDTKDGIGCLVSKNPKV